jgi:drug/metabolite transporter (DMT)-like permease
VNSDLIFHAFTTDNVFSLALTRGLAQEQGMALHQASGRWKLGLLLALVTAACWATLPIALKVSLEVLDPLTLTWFRFLVAAVIMGAWLAARGRLGAYRGLSRRHWGMLAIAATMLVGNYVLYLFGVQFTSPGNAQVLIQLAPLLMALGGIFVFGETYRWPQWCGLAVIVAGLAAFFADQWNGGSGAGAGYVLGSAIVVLAAIVWAIYALAQKQLLQRLDSPEILWAIYVAATVSLWPAATPGALAHLDARHWWLVGYCALNTLVAYGAFAEALAHWEASRVSAILATTPLLCLAAVAAVHSAWPQVLAPEQVGIAGYVGAAAVVVGSSMSSLLGQSRGD